MAPSKDVASGTDRASADEPDSGQIGALVMALAVAGAVALFAPSGAGRAIELSPASEDQAGDSGHAYGAAREARDAEPARAGATDEAARQNAPDSGPDSSEGTDAVPNLDATTSVRAGLATETPSYLDGDAEVDAAASGSAGGPASDARAGSAADEGTSDASGDAPGAASTATREAASVALAPLPTPSSPDFPIGAAASLAPYFSLSRPFGADLENRASRFYPYGTDAGGEYLLHHGVDIGNSDGTPVLAVADGTVVYAGADTDEIWGPQSDFYGQLVIVRHDGAEVAGSVLHSLYGHLSGVEAETGAEVLTGDVLGLVGMTGVALGPHLHLELRLGAEDYGATRNPELFLAPRAGVGTIVGRLRDGENRPLPGRTVTLHESSGEAAGRWLGATTTYPGAGVVPAAGWNENFLFGDVAPGSYFLTAETDGIRASAPVTVTAGAAVIAALTVAP